MLFQIGVFPWVMIALTPIFFAPDWPTCDAPPSHRIRRRRGRAGRADSPTSRRRHTDDGRAGRARRAERRPAAAPLPRRRQRPLQRRRVLPVVAGDAHRTNRLPGVRRHRPDDRRDVAGPARRRPRRVAGRRRPRSAPTSRSTTAHLVAADFARRGHPDVEVRADSWVAFNGRPRQRWIDPTVDLAALDRRSPASRYVLPIASAEPSRR